MNHEGDVERKHDAKRRNSRMSMLEIHAAWDDEAKVWVATSDDVPGLCAQADTLDELIEIVADLTPALLAANHVTMPALIPLHILAERTAMIRPAA